MIDTQDSRAAVLAVLQAFQDGYVRRDLQAVDAFLELFTPDIEIIGTNADKPGEGEWCLGTAMARELVHGDWEGWGDVRLDMENARVRARGDVAWLSTPGTVSMHIGEEENYQNFLEYMQQIITEEKWPAKEKLLYIQRGTSNTLYELSRGEQFVWPFRFTAVLVRQMDGRWLFEMMEFSFPTTRFPDERIIESNNQS